MDIPSARGLQTSQKNVCPGYEPASSMAFLPQFLCRLCMSLFSSPYSQRKYTRWGELSQVSEAASLFPECTLPPAGHRISRVFAGDRETERLSESERQESEPKRERERGERERRTGPD